MRFGVAPACWEVMSLWIRRTVGDFLQELFGGILEKPCWVLRIMGGVYRFDFKAEGDSGLTFWKMKKKKK